MYISKIEINGFRNFLENTIEFNDGINVIIGHNNSGKTNLLKAVSLVINTKESKKLSIDDFCKNTTLDKLKESPPQITISLTFTKSEEESARSEDLVTVSTWLTKIDPPYEAQLTYCFFLPEQERSSYETALSGANELDTAWKIIQHEFIKKYIYKIFCGKPDLQVTVDTESLQKFDFQFLDAIRDVERDMFTGKNTLLKEVLDFFIDYDIKNQPKGQKSNIDKYNEIKVKRDDFSLKAKGLIDDLQSRMLEGKNEILKYAKSTGATLNSSNPNFEGAFSESEIFSVLKLIVEHQSGMKIPVTHNGLGYNNLIFMSLLLARMQVSTNIDYLGSNAVIFPILAIEEPEAHLHPSMQHKFLKFLRENKYNDAKVRQIFVTSHSTHITSSVSLDEIICLHSTNNETKIGYPKKCFPDTPDGIKSKAYVERFLDATRSDMLFAQRVIFVEGIAEQLLIPVLAKYNNMSLEDHHIAIINVGGRYFNHFLYLFDTNKEFTINKIVCCITDRDPVRKMSGGKYQTCYPFEIGIEPATYCYKNNSDGLISEYENHPNIRFYSQDVKYGKTFEYDIAWHNPDSKLLLTDSITNKSELETLLTNYSKESVDFFISKLGTSDENKRIREAIQSNELKWEDDDKIKSIISARYLNSIGKGENALELRYQLDTNLAQDTPDKFIIPHYIKEALAWTTQ